MRIPIVDDDGAPAWPEVFPLEKIDELRQTVGARHFSAQMMLRFVAVEKARLDADALHLYSDDFDPRSARIGSHVITGAAAYWDPSGGRVKSDGSVCALVYRDDKNRRVFIHDVLYLVVDDGDRHPLAHQCDMVLDFLQRHNLRHVAIETNGLGNALPEIMRDVATRRGMNVSIQKIINNRNKEQRILDAIEPLLTTGRLYMHTRVRGSFLIAEMQDWSPVGGAGRDDGLDAVAGAIAMTPRPVRAIGTAVRPYRATTDFKI
ncbi:MAG: hypothetical protein K2L94_02310 [Alphaproteobacteria bacterium]|nr:hypothetical protein [Alphaproteobacteria bacterium]